MGDILAIPERVGVHIERRVDDIETQKLSFRLIRDVHFGTETGNTINLFGHDKEYNTVELDIEIPVEVLAKNLADYLGFKLVKK